MNILSFRKEQEEQKKQDISLELLQWLDQMELIETRSYFENSWIALDLYQSRDRTKPLRITNEKMKIPKASGSRK